MWKDFFHFTKREKQGILVLAVLVGGIFIGKLLFSKQEKTIAPEQIISPESNAENDNYQPPQYSKGNNKKPEYVKPIRKLQVFDPNTADSALFVTLGIKPYIARNIIKYRNKGGKFKQPQDLSKIYGLSPELVQELIPYVSIASSEVNKSRNESLPDNSNCQQQNLLEEKAGRVKSPENQKYALGVKVNINTADSTELKKIPKVGQSYASRILKYRQMLGGFYSVEQIKEVYGMDEQLFGEIAQWMQVENDSIRLISVNKSSLDRLKSHPYINFYQAKAIIDMRTRKGKIKDISAFTLLEEFSASDLERIKYYLSFD